MRLPADEDDPQIDEATDEKIACLELRSGADDERVRLMAYLKLLRRSPPSHNGIIAFGNAGTSAD